MTQELSRHVADSCFADLVVRAVKGLHREAFLLWVVIRAGQFDRNVCGYSEL